MRLDAIDEHHAIGFGGESVEQHWGAVVELADLDDIHGRLDRAAHTLSVETVTGQHLLLAFSRSAAMAAHSRQQKRPAASLFDAVDDGAGDEWDIGDTAAAARNGDSRAGGNDVG